MDINFGAESNEPWVDWTVVLMAKLLPMKGVANYTIVSRQMVLDIVAQYHTLLADGVVEPMQFSGMKSEIAYGTPTPITAVTMMKVKDALGLDLQYVLACFNAMWWSYSHDGKVPLSQINPYKNQAIQPAREEVKLTDAGKKTMLEQFVATTGITPKLSTDIGQKVVIVAIVGIAAYALFSKGIPGIISAVK